MSVLRAAALTTSHALTPRSVDEYPAPSGRLVDGMCVTAARDDEHARVVHVSTVRDVPTRHGWYRIRIWRELSAISPN